MQDLVMFHGHHDYEFIAHSHEVLTVILIIRGQVQIEIEGANYQVFAGQLVLIGAHQIHAARPINDAGWEMRSMHLPPGLLFGDSCGVSRVSETVGFTRPIHSASRGVPIFLDMHQSSRMDRSGVQHELFQRFIEWLSRDISAFEPRIVARGPVDIRLLRAKDLIAQAMFDNTLIESIAQEAGLSTYALIRRFKRNYGISPHAWRMQTRANEAARLLQRKYSLAEAAAACGFADQAHMTRVFKKVFGVTPGQYSLMK